MKRSIIYTLGLGLLLGTALSGCTDWDDHYEASAGEGGDATLAEQIASRAELSDFYEVLQNTMVFRHHRKTSVSYADLLSQGQQLTVIAPQNGTFDKDALIAQARQSAAGDSIVEKYFVGNHIARGTFSDLKDGQSILLLNGKHITLGQATAEGVQLTGSNNHAKNGILHTATRQLPYTNNLYEQLIEDYPDLAVFLTHYDEDYFDENNSVQSGMIDGVPVYADSVIIQRNLLLNSIGQLASEDSTYWVVMPERAEWDRLYAEAAEHFTYPTTLAKADSVQQYWTMRSLLQDGIFSMTTTNKIAPQDSLVSKQYNRSEPEFSVYYRPNDAGGILYGTTEQQCSNGKLFHSPTWTMSPEMTYLRRNKVEGEATWLRDNYHKCTCDTRSHVADSISKNAYLDIKPESATSNWDITYNIKNVLSGTYDVGIVMLPMSVEGADESKLKPTKFKATISYIDADGKQQTYTCLNPAGKKEFTNDPTRVDTVMIAPDFFFPVSNYSRDELRFTITMTCSITAKENSKHNREVYLDCFYLQPKRNTND